MRSAQIKSRMRIARQPDLTHFLHAHSVPRRLEGQSRSSDRSSRWKIKLKIQTSGDMKGPGEGWSKGGEGRKEEEEGGGFLILPVEKVEDGRGSSFFRPRRSKTGGPSISGIGRSKKPPHLRRTPPSSKKSHLPPVICPI